MTRNRAAVETPLTVEALRDMFPPERKLTPFEHGDRAEQCLHRAMRIVEMQQAIALVCGSLDNDVAKEELVAIFAGLEIVNHDLLLKDLAAADNAVSGLRDALREAERQAP